jgi:hypothetical protein
VIVKGDHSFGIVEAFDVLSGLSVVPGPVDVLCGV